MVPAAISANTFALHEGAAAIATAAASQNVLPDTCISIFVVQNFDAICSFFQRITLEREVTSSSVPPMQVILTADYCVRAKNNNAGSRKGDSVCRYADVVIVVKNSCSSSEKKGEMAHMHCA